MAVEQSKQEQVALRAARPLRTAAGPGAVRALKHSFQAIGPTGTPGVTGERCRSSSSRLVSDLGQRGVRATTQACQDSSALVFITATEHLVTPECGW